MRARSKLERAEVSTLSPRDRARAQGVFVTLVRVPSRPGPYCATAEIGSALSPSLSLSFTHTAFLSLSLPSTLARSLRQRQAARRLPQCSFGPQRPAAETSARLARSLRRDARRGRAGHSGPNRPSARRMAHGPGRAQERARRATGPPPTAVLAPPATRGSSGHSSTPSPHSLGGASAVRTPKGPSPPVVGAPDTHSILWGLERQRHQRRVRPPVVTACGCPPPLPSGQVAQERRAIPAAP